MKMLSRAGALSVGLMPLVASGCGDSSSNEVVHAVEPVVYTTFYPTTYFTERIVGDALRVVCPVPEDADPIFWQPSRDHLAAFQSAGLIVVNGASFEKWIEQASLPASRMVDTAASFSDQWIQYESATTHSHGAGGEHTHEGTDGHTWLDPQLARVQAEAIKDALVSRFAAEDADLAAAFDKGFAALSSDLDELDIALRELTPDLAEARLLASHPAYNYLAKRYDWSIRNFDLDPGEVLNDDQMTQVRAAMEGEGRPIMLWEGEPLPEIRAALDAVGVRSVLFSPCELLGEDELAAGTDYLSVMRENLARLRAALEQH